MIVDLADLEASTWVNITGQDSQSSAPTARTNPQVGGGRELSNDLRRGSVKARPKPPLTLVAA